MYSQMFELHAQLLKALAHPKRLEIVNLLRDQPLCVSDIYEMLDLPQANISQHLTTLRETGILQVSRDGKQMIYGITDLRVITAIDLFREFLIDQNQGKDIAAHLKLTMHELLPLTHDPVCKMRVSPKTASGVAHYQNQDYYFCASGCQRKFTQNPEKYVKN